MTYVFIANQHEIFETPFRGLRGDDHLRLIGKLVADFLLVLIELFC